jgi:polyisoprenoid-binding protein YceI
MSVTATDPTAVVGTYVLDPVHSTATFAVKHIVSTFRGGFAVESASFEVTPEGPAALSGVAKVDSVDVRQADLKGHLLSPDFFDAERTPEIRFSSSRLTGEVGGEVTLEGELEIKGTTRPITATGIISEPVVGPDGNARIAVELETKLDRNDYGIGWNMDLPGGRKALGDDVTLTVVLELVREEA